MVGCLCIHGYTGGPYEIGPLTEYLKENTDWEIKTPILPGHGKELELKDKTYKEWIDQAEKDFLELRNRCQKLYIIGFSMGGMIAAYLAAKYQVAKLVLLSASGKYIDLKRMTMEVGRFLLKGAERQLDTDELVEDYKRKRDYLSIKSMLEFRRCIRFLRPYLKEVDCPVLVIQGRHDSLVPPIRNAYYIDEQVPVETTLILYDQSNHHMCLGKDKDVIIQSVSSFLTNE